MGDVTLTAQGTAWRVLLPLTCQRIFGTFERYNGSIDQKKEPRQHITFVERGYRTFIERGYRRHEMPGTCVLVLRPEQHNQGGKAPVQRRESYPHRRNLIVASPANHAGPGGDKTLNTPLITNGGCLQGFAVRCDRGRLGSIAIKKKN